MSTLALSMIVRNAAAILPACLASVRPCVDEMVIADTGSTDATIQVAKRFGARLVSVPWTNHFAEARNHALQHVTADWVLSLDADEQLDRQAPRHLKTLLDRDVAGFAVTIRNYVLRLEERVWDRPAKPNDGALSSAAKYPGFVEHENIRLFRRDSDIYFVGRVHESVGPRILELRRKIAPASFVIHHFGLATDAETRARKNNFYRDLGLQKIREMPDNAQAHLELGIVQLDNFGNLPEALALFQRACRLHPKLGVAWFFAGLTLVKLERLSEALHALTEAEQCGHNTALVAETQGDAFYNLNQPVEAAQSYDLAARRDPTNLPLQSKLGLAQVRAGQRSQGLSRIARALDRNPKLPELHDRMVLACVFLDRLTEAASAAEEKLRVVAYPEPRDFLRAASLCAKAGQMARCVAALEQGLQAFPQNEQLQRAFHEVSAAPAAL
jgi:tetratricopeptide (TPR) repeat protein